MSLPPRPRASAILQLLKAIEEKRREKSQRLRTEPETSRTAKEPSGSEMLTPSELESLHQHAKELAAFAQKHFAAKQNPR